MQRTTQFFRAAWRTGIAAAALATAACGGGGGGSGGNVGGSPPAPPPVSAPAAPVPVLSTGIKTLIFNWAAVPDATHYRLQEELQGGDYVQVGADMPAATTRYEHTVPLWTRLLANYRLQACNAAGCTASATQTWSIPLLNASIGYVKASNTQASDFFGVDVALSGDGSTLAVAATFEDGGEAGVNGNGADNSASAAGAVYVFARAAPGGWSQQAYLKASNPDSSDFFGSALSLSADGNTLAVGAFGEDSNAIGTNGDQLSNAASASGAAYIFQRSNGNWAQTTYLKATNTAAGASFGSALAISGDGNTLVVGAPGESGNATGVNSVPADYTATGSGAAYVYHRTATSWIIQAYLKSNQADISDQFGSAVAISHDGNRVAVGAPQEDGSATGVGGTVSNLTDGSGAVFLFVRSNNDWSTEAYVKASNPGVDDGFGGALALSGDGTTLVVGASAEDSSSVGINGDQNDNTVLQSGAVYAFDLQAGIWSQRAYIKASNTATLAFFGSSVALSFDGRQMAIGASGESNAGLGFGGNPFANDASVALSGAVYMLQRDGSAWQIRRFMKASNANAGDQFGAALALSADGSTLAVGARNEDSAATGIGGNPNDASALSAGAVYLY
jgi:hypothetical protein